MLWMTEDEEFDGLAKQPHDAFFKTVLSDPERAAAFFQGSPL